ncbi:MAG TPA: alpha/beta fold hydrolase [Gemmatimonadaceae bacterium]|nr:alpha/beta fold hydrolase [Gemmatimonadaceae bacterium]
MATRGTGLRAIERAAREVNGGRRVTIDFELRGERLPALLLTPATRAPVAAALLLHGYTSHKERMAESVGRALLGRGIASLALDLPLHGEREGSLDVRAMRSPFELLRRWRMALDETRLALRWLAAHDGIDPDRVGLVGYSLGSFVGVMAAADEPVARAVVLAAGGDLPTELPFGALVRTAADPQRAVRRLEGRPLLMVNGRLDRTVRPDQAERLFAAAREPKEIRWYGGGHWPPASEIDAAAEWLARRLSAPGLRLPASG